MYDGISMTAMRVQAIPSIVIGKPHDKAYTTPVKVRSWFAVTVGISFIVAMSARCGGEPAPLMLTPAHVEGEWPFRASEVQVSCCIGGQISIESGGQSYWFEGARYDRYPVTQLGREGVEPSAFGAAHEAARRLARERWPDDVR